MAMNELAQNVDLSFKLQIALAPRMLQMLKILNLPFQEMTALVESAAEENPMLELEKPEVIFEYAKYLGSNKIVKKVADFSEYDGLKNISPESRDLKTHLASQLKLTCLSKEDFAVAEELIDNIDDNGYLKNFEEVVKELGSSKEQAEKVLKVIQTFEPDGVGARDAAECLLIQLREFGIDDPEVEDVVGQIISGYLEMLGEKKYKEIADALDISEKDVADAANFIKNNLTPYPASGFAREERTVLPSFAVEKKGGDFIITDLEARYGPKITISRQYEKMIKDPRTDEKTVKFLKTQLEKAKEMIEDLDKRQDTGGKIMKIIVEKQKEFFTGGPDYFRPLQQIEIAQKLGLHPSTISRAIAEKYVQTPGGMFALKYLCPRELSGCSAYEIKSRIKKMIEAEDPHNPLSDGKIFDRLKAEGLAIGKRTVAGYRQQLKFKSFKDRKK